MNQYLKHELHHFLTEHLNPDKPVLLALSGGPDSLALLYLLLECQKKRPFALNLAHVDHGWREESEQEAKQLHELALHLHLPFHLKKLNPRELHGNLEMVCREERLKFFRELAERYQYQAVILAHHADDQAETVLKRLLEGADLSCMGGLQKKTEMHGLHLWRPWLNITKAAILSWLQQHNHTPFFDRTNCDPKFLRGRFRTQIIPYLAEKFGKEISSNLCHLGEEVQELKHYLSTRVDPFLARLEAGSMGVLLDLSQHCPQESVEIKYLLRQLAKQEGLTLSREIVDTMCAHIISGKGNRHVTAGSKTICLDRRRIFILHHRVETLPPPLLLQEGTHQYGPWHITVSCRSHPVQCHAMGWKCAWSGKSEISLPADTYHLGPAVMYAPYPGSRSSISKWWTNEKVPAFLRHCMPVIWRNDQIYHELLTGRFISNRQVEQQQQVSWLHVSLSWS